MTTQQFPHPTIHHRTTVYLVLVAALAVAAFSIGRYQRDDGAAETLTVAASTSSWSLSPSWVAPASMTEGAWLAEHDAAITGILGIAPSTALEPSLVTPAPMTEAAWLAEHEAQITGVLGTSFDAAAAVPRVRHEAGVLAQHADAINGVLGHPARLVYGYSAR